jgi:hypothetical protein
MQTIPVDPKLQNTAAQHASNHAPNNNNYVEPLPPLAPEVVSGSRTTSKSATAHPRSHVNTHAELDAMLIRDPNTGAVHGLRFALLFNAGLALSGLMAWELWSLLAS